MADAETQKDKPVRPPETPKGPPEDPKGPPDPKPGPVTPPGHDKPRRHG